MRRFSNLKELEAAVGEQLGSSDWTLFDDTRIAAFNSATGQGQQPGFLVGEDQRLPLAAPPALTLSMLATFGRQIYAVESRTMAVNYGLGRVRFLSPVPYGSRVRGSAQLLQCEPLPGGAHVVLAFTVEREGASDPVCKAESIVRIFE